MFEEHNSTIFEILSVVDGLDLDYMDSMEEYCRENSLSLSGELIEAGLFEHGDLLQLVADYLGYDYLEVLPTEFSNDLLVLIDAETARNYAVIPYAIQDGVVHCQRDAYYPICKFNFAASSQRSSFRYTL